MTGKTHDLAAFVALLGVIAYSPVPGGLNWPTVIVAFGANFAGGLFPDIDQRTSDFWDNFRMGPFISRFVCKALGGHRNLSHSILGIFLTGWLLALLLDLIPVYTLIPITTQLVWDAFMIGVLSHVGMDLLTKAGVRLLWPFDLLFGIPPIKALRIETGEWVEEWLIVPGLILLLSLLVLSRYQYLWTFLQHIS